MGSNPSKKVSHFTIKDVIPLRSNNNNFQVLSPNGTVKTTDSGKSALKYFTHPGVRITQPQEEESLPSNPQGYTGKTKRKYTSRGS